MNNNFISLSVMYEDLPDLIELEMTIQYCGWSASATAYSSPQRLLEEARRLREWTMSPVNSEQISAGREGMGWWVLKFYTIDHAGHVRCAAGLSTEHHDGGLRPADRWQMSIEVATELGLVERFTTECIAMGSGVSQSARLIGVPI